MDPAELETQLLRDIDFALNVKESGKDSPRKLLVPRGESWLMFRLSQLLGRLGLLALYQDACDDTAYPKLSTVEALMAKGRTGRPRQGEVSDQSE